MDNQRSVTEGQGASRPQAPVEQRLRAPLPARPASPPIDALRSRHIMSAHWPGILLLLGAAALYWLTLANGLQPYQLLGGDLITHQYAQVQGRFSNAPGYPLYTMGGWLWFHLGRLVLGLDRNPIPILSSYSTLWALVALWLLYLLALEVTDRGRGGNQVVAVLASSFYAVTYFFWYYAVTTEQYTSAVAWTLAVVYLAFRWERTRRDAYLLWLALLVGVALAHMLTLILILPPLVWFLLRCEPGLVRRQRLIAAAFGLALLPLLSYLFVYVRGAQHPEWRGAGQWTGAWQWFLSFLSTRQGRGELTWSWQPFFTEEFPALIWRELTWPGLIAGLVGLAGLGARRATMIYVTLAIYLAFCWIDRLGNWYQVIIPAYALVVLGLAVAADALWRAWPAGQEEERQGKRRSLAALQAAGTLGMAALVLYRGLASYPMANMRDRPDNTGLLPGWAILADDPPPGTLVLGTLPEEQALSYLTVIWGLRPDVQATTSARAREVLAEGGSPLAVTYAALPLAADEIGGEIHFSSLGRSLVALRAEPQTALPSGFRAVDEDFGDGIWLRGLRVARDRATGDFGVSLVWQAAGQPAHDWSVSVRLQQAAAQVGQQDQTHPIAGAFPFTRWSPGEVVIDRYTLEPAPGAAPDTVTVLLYTRAADGSFANLHSATFAAEP